MSVLKRLRARMTGYSDGPCPLCGREFYGFEWDGQSVPCRADHITGHGICPRCISEGKAVQRTWPDTTTLTRCPICERRPPDVG